MSITRRDNAVVVVLVIVLVALGGVIAMPGPAPAAIPTPTPEPTLPSPATYREGVVGVPEAIMPVVARTRAERTLVGLIFSGLVRLGPDNTYEPDLAASWTTDAKGKAWTFKIRDDAEWQDGEPVTADDVVFTVEALKDPAASGAMAGAWAEVTATAIDPKTVRIQTATPIAGFLAAATQPLLPAHLLADVPLADLAKSDFARAPVGTGPYFLAEIDDRQAVLIPAAMAGQPDQEAPTSVAPTPTLDSLGTPAPTATPPHALPYLEQIEIHFYDDDTAAADAFAAGEVDAIAGLPPVDAAALATEAGVERVRYPTTTLATVLLNVRASHPELRDARVRRALLGALDRTAIVQGALGGDGTAAQALVSAESWAFDEASAAPVKYDLKAAGKLLTEAGWKKGKAGAWTAKGGKAPYKLQLLTVPADANPGLAQVSAAIAKAWTDFGIATEVVETPAADLADKLRGGEFAAAALDITMGLEPDLYPLLASSQVRGSGTNLSGYQDPALDTLLEAARKPGTPEQRMAAWKALLAGLATRQPLLPIAWHAESVLFRGVEGPTPRFISGPGDRFWDVLAWRLAADR
jgi:peptide/nickel transport system substrate-binding protein